MRKSTINGFYYWLIMLALLPSSFFNQVCAMDKELPLMEINTRLEEIEMLEIYNNIIPMPSRPSDFLLASFSEKNLPTQRTGIAGNIVLESDDNKTAIFPQALSRHLMIKEMRNDKILPIKLSGILFTAFVESLKALDSITSTVPEQYAQALVKALEPILKNISFGGMVKLFAEINKHDVQPVIWYMSALFATKILQATSINELSVITEKLASLTDLTALVVHFLLLDKNAEEALTKLSLVSTFKIPISFTISCLIGRYLPVKPMIIKDIPKKGRFAVIGSDDGKIYVWNLSLHCKEPQKILKASWASVKFIAISQDGDKLLSSSGEKAIWWDLTTNAIIHELNHRSFISTLALSPDSKKAITGCRDGTVTLWDLSSGRSIKELKNPIGSAWLTSTTRVESIAFSPDGNQLAIGFYGRVALCNLDSGQVIKWLEIKSGKYLENVNQLLFTSGSTILVEVWDGKFAVFWDVASGSAKRFEVNEDERLTSIAVDSTGRYALTGSHKGGVILHNLAVDTMVCKFQSGQNIGSIAFTADGRQITALATDGTICNFSLINKLQQVVLCMKIAELGKDNMLKDPYFKKVYDALVIEQHALVNKNSMKAGS